MVSYTLNWTNRAQKQMKEAHEYISIDPQIAAKKLINEIMIAVERAIDNLEIYRPDKYKINNDGTCRAFELHHYRIAYRFNDRKIRVLQVRHTKNKPIFY